MGSYSGDLLDVHITPRRYGLADYPPHPYHTRSRARHRRATQHILVVDGDNLPSHPHPRTPKPTKRYQLIRQAHDEMGHKGTYSVWSRLSERFWWPHMDRQIKWFIQTCHACQVRSFRKYHIPPVIAEPAPLFRKAYVDTMLMPKAGGLRYIVQARCSLTSWPEWRALRTETGKTIGEFLFQEVLCRWGGLA